MSNYTTITLSDANISIQGKPLAKEREKEIKRQKMLKSSDSDITQDDIESFVEGAIPSKREAEKTLLVELVSVQLKSAKISKYNKLCDLAAQIEDADDKVEIDNEDLQDLREAFEKTAEGKDGKGRPIGWRYCRELLKQIEKPKEEEKPKDADNKDK